MHRSVHPWPLALLAVLPACSSWLLGVDEGKRAAYVPHDSGVFPGPDVMSSDGGAAAPTQTAPDDAGKCSGVYEKCGDVCADLQNDSVHCGHCFESVPEGGLCVKGEPQCPGSHPPANWMCGSTATWKRVNLPTQSDLYDIWGSSPNDVWTVGDEAKALHWDGSAWTNYVLPLVNLSSGPARLWAVWGLNANDVWVLGQSLEVAHWDGTRWTTMTAGNGELTDIWGASSNDVWATGIYSGLLHWNGTSWSKVTVTPTDANYKNERLWGFGANDIWAVGSDGQAMHWTGAQWNMLPLPSNQDFLFVGGPAADDVWILSEYAGVRYNGTLASSMGPFPLGRRAMWFSSRNDAWAANLADTIEHWNGKRWTTSSLDHFGSTATITSIFGTSANDVWAAGGRGRLFHYSP